MSAQQYSFVTPLECLKVDGHLGSAWTISADLKISKSKAVAKNLISPLVRRKIGDLEADAILAGTPFLFTTSDYPLQDSSSEAQMDLLNARLQIAVAFCNLLWLIKDNSVNFGQGVLQYPNSTSAAQTRISTNRWIARYTTADGKLRVTKFSKPELEEIISLYGSLYGQIRSEDTTFAETPGTAGSIDRLSRAFFYLQAARATSDFPQKVANYCTCFEALVSTSPLEITHQVAERMAVLISNDSSDALQTYRNIKKAYDTRSKYVHGDEMTKSEDLYRIQSENCDDYLRRALTVILTEQEIVDLFTLGTRIEVDEFFLTRLLDVTE